MYELDIIFAIKTDENEWHKNESYQKITTDQYPLVVSNQHPFSSKDRIYLKGIKNEPFIILAKNASSLGYEEIMKHCFRQGFTPKIISEQQNYETIGALISANFGVSIIPNTLKGLLNHDVTFIEIIDNPFIYDVIVTWINNSTAVTSFINELNKVIKSN